MPSLKAGTTSVTLQTGTDGGTRTEVGLPLVVEGISILAIRPSAGPIQGGASVTLVGNNLPSRLQSISFGPFSAKLSSVSSTLAVCLSPSATHSGPQPIYLDAEAVHGQIEGMKLAYEYYDLPSMSELVPSEGPPGGGAAVTVTGGGFSTVPALGCVFGDLEALDTIKPASVLTSSLLLCIAPSAPSTSGQTTYVELMDTRLRLTLTRSGLVFAFVRLAAIEKILPSGTSGGGLARAGSTLTILGRDFTTLGLYCKLGSHRMTMSAYVSSSVLLCPLPKTVTGRLSLVLSKEGLDFSNTAWVSIREHCRAESLLPSAGSVAGGTRVVVKTSPTSLKNVALSGVRCTFGDTAVPAVAVNESSSEVTCVAPSRWGSDPNRVRFILATRETGVEGCDGALLFEYQEVVRIQDVIPSRGSVRGGSFVDVVGSGFISSKTSCKFGDTMVHAWDEATASSSTSVRCRVPPAIGVGEVSVRVSVNGGTDYTDTSLTYLYELSATVQALRPSRALSGVAGQMTTVIGYHFHVDAEIRCRFGPLDVVNGKYLSSSLALCIIPMRAQGTVSLVIETPRGVEARGTALLELQSCPVNLMLRPSSGPVRGGTMIMLNQAYDPHWPMLNATCVIDGVSSKAETVGGSRFCISPPASAVGLSSLRMLGGDSVDFVTLSSAFLFYSDPAVSDILPSRGTIRGGTLVTLLGTGFLQVGLACRFGSEPAGTGPDARWLSSTMAIIAETRGSYTACVTPAHAGFGTINLTILRQSLVLARASYTYVHEPRVLRMVPSTGSVGSITQVSIFGMYLSLPGLRCRFGEAYTPVNQTLQLTSTLMQCYTPAVRDPGSVKVLLGLEGDWHSSEEQRFWYLPLPSVRRLSPSLAFPSPQGLVVTVLGEHFESGEALTCRFGDHQSISTTLISSTKLMCTLHEHKDTSSLLLTVSNDGSTYSLQGLPLHIQQPSILVACSPSIGPSSGGTVVTMEVTPELMPPAVGVGCMFGETIASQAQVFGSVIRCISPKVLVPGLVNISLIDQDTELELVAGAVPYLYFASPYVRSISPCIGSRSGGTLVHIAGTGFLLKGVSCRFGNATVDGDRARAITSTLVECVSPAAGEIGMSMVEVSFNGVDYTTDEISFMYKEDLTIHKIMPTQGRAGQSEAMSLKTSQCLVKGYNLGCLSYHWDAKWIYEIRPSVFPTSGGQFLSSSLLMCDAASHESGRVMVAVSFNRVDFTEGTVAIEYYKTLSLHSLVPSFGPRTRSSLISVFGSGFQAESALSCRFGHQSSLATVIHERLLICRTPSQNPGSVNFAVVNLLGFNLGGTSLEFEYTELCPILQVSPSSAAIVGGTEIKVILGCQYPQSALCRFGNLTAPAYFLTGSSLLCVTPQATPSTVNLDVVSEDTSSVSIATLFRFEHGARVYNVVPTSMMHSSPQSQVTVLGEHFAFSSTLGCRLGGRTLLQAYWVSSSFLTCPLVSFEPGNVTIEVTNNGHDYSQEYSYVCISPDEKLGITLYPTYGPTMGGTEITLVGVNAQTAPQQESFPNAGFSYIDSPSLSLVFPSVVPQQERYLIKVMGSGLANELSYFCRFESDIQAPTRTPATIASSDVATCFTPSLVAGAYSMRLTCSEGVLISKTFLNVLSTPLPVVTKLLPSLHFSNSISMVTVLGKHFLKTDGLTCKVQKSVIRAVWIDNETLICQLPQLNFVGNATLEVSNNGVDFPMNSNILSVVSRTVLVAVEPSTVWGLQGATLTLTGNHIITESDVLCKFNVRKVSVALPISSTQVICKMPASLPGLVSVMLFSPATKANSNSVSVQITSGISIEDLPPAEPSSGPPAGGTQVYIKGEFLIDGTFACSFGNTRVTAALASSSLLKCVSPAGKSGCVQVSILEHVSGSVMPLAKTFCYENVAYIESIVPDRAHWRERVVLEVLGGVLLDTVNLCGRIGDTVMPCRWISSRKAKCLVTFPAPGSYSFEISNNCQDFSGRGAEFVAEDLTRIVGIKPTAGFSTGGSTILVSLKPKPTDLVQDWSKMRLMCQFNEQLSAAELVQGGTAAEHVRCLQPTCVPTESSDFRLLYQGSAFSDTISFACRDPSVAHSITPSFGPVGGGTRILVSGVGFTNASSCYFGVFKTSGYMVSSKLFVCIAPTALGRTQSLITTMGVTEVDDLFNSAKSSVLFQYEKPIVVSRIVPNVLMSSSTKQINVYGSGFRPGAIANCKFGVQVVQSIAVISSTRLLCSTPYLVNHQNISVEISNNGIDFSNSGLRISFTESKAVILNVYPSTIANGVSEVITITGSRSFSDDNIECRFGNESSLARQIEPTKILCYTPRFGQAGTISVEVVTVHRGLYDAVGMIAIVVKSAFHISAVIPTSGPTSGGTLVSIIGTNMPSGGFECKLRARGHLIEQMGITISSTVVLCNTPPVEKPSTYQLDFGEARQREQRKVVPWSL
ncbi:hypothetical protein GUITHDRAFT_141645 [Guillardia theta CCMP2712]|uniref:IPT/TIG domain-containing protein n=1 Tax=Guillardia theta (strain CCMP2712) TaxID=905079 RepID=L1J0S3_GUITC|nr:hypothetical protein GUITHDRAFT_141645 [Guillardia theta CCMP2712]EKX41897.1 hypothetical protein GUITHDRAFT_141645 [Guillardia theta CCMP2712]|eukprot:XP_005828877.1 hypothetical protein GUITHDRAFT_141645 [Guillardia theta CCMP2712]